MSNVFFNMFCQINVQQFNGLTSLQQVILDLLKQQEQANMVGEKKPL